VTRLGIAGLAVNGAVTLALAGHWLVTNPRLRRWLRTRRVRFAARRLKARHVRMLIEAERIADDTHRSSR